MSTRSSETLVLCGNSRSKNKGIFANKYSITYHFCNKNSKYSSNIKKQLSLIRNFKGHKLGFASREFPPGKFPGNPKFSFPVSREIFLVISREIREILSNIYSRNMGNFNEFSSILTKRNTYFYILVVKVHHSRSIFHEYFESRFFI